jgi:hypothetical protein
MKTLCLFWAVALTNLYAQSLHLSAASATPSGTAAVTLSLESPPGKEPLALQWEVVYPSPQLGAEGSDFTAGQAAKASGKSLTCAGKPADADTYVYRCILAGGQKAIGNGPVATLTFHIRSAARTGTAAVQIQNAAGVSASLKKIDIGPAQVGIAID